MLTYRIEASLRRVALRRMLTIFLPIVVLAALYLAEGRNVAIAVIGFSVVTAVLALNVLQFRTAFTVLDDEGVRTKFWFRDTRWPWSEILSIDEVRGRRYRYLAMYRNDGGRRALLGAPMTGGMMSDPEFSAKAEQVYQFWREHQAIDAVD